MGCATQLAVQHHPSALQQQYKLEGEQARLACQTKQDSMVAHKLGNDNILGRM
jgi:hypothetical protein